MVLALDFDNTFTLDPRYWLNWIHQTHAWHHRVLVVTYRQPSHPLEFDFSTVGVEVHYTDHVGKKKYMESMGIKVDVWVDDRAECITTDGLA